MDFKKYHNNESHIKISVELCVCGDFDPAVITDRMGIFPYKSAIKASGNATLGLPLFSGWSISGGCLEKRQDLLTFNKLINNIQKILSGKEERFRSLMKELRAEVGLVVLVTNYDSKSEFEFGFELNKESIRFLNDIDASFEIDAATVVE